MDIRTHRVAQLEVRLLATSMGFAFREVELPRISI
jgi:hypothetical protein